MGTFHIAWSAQGVESVEAATPERAAEIVDSMLADHLQGLTLVDSPDLEPRERAA